MKFLSVRDLRSKSAQVWRELPNEREMVITSNGRPVAVLTSVDETSVEKSLAAWRQVRVTQAITSIQQESMRQATDSISMEDIDEEIGKARNARRKRTR
ncbi:MAG: type II toxin-antitoxin system prevent-host-death family antitoxin [Spirochaetaceae bacterium]|nr:type II toxin-antitoxin system prevent-host-death family antitoxin [Spirochaetaceae bacterium]